MAKVSDKKKVEQLEKCVLENDYEALKEVLDEYSDFEFMARALGLACRFRSLDMVKLLVEHGATFNYESSTSIKSKYGVVTQAATGEYYADYAILLCLCNFNDDRRVGKITTGLDSIYTIAHLNHMPVNSEQERIAIIDFLLSKNILTDLQKENVLYQAILNGQREIAGYLLSKGETISASDDDHFYYGFGNMERFHCRYVKALTGSDNIYERQELLNQLIAFPKDAKDILSDFISILSKQGEKLKLTKTFVPAVPADILTSEFFDHLDITSITPQVLFEKATKDNNEELLDFLISSDIRITSKAAQELLPYAEGRFKTLFEKIIDSGKAKKVTPQKKDKGNKKSLVASGDTRTDEQKAAQFGYKKNGDGTISITEMLDDALYKKMIIPESIDGDVVTTIDINKFYKTVKALYIPNTVKTIQYRSSSIYNPNIGQTEVSPDNQVYSSDGECLLSKDGKILYKALHLSMTEYVIPEGVENVDVRAFDECTRLKKIVLPSSLKEVEFKLGEKVNDISGGDNVQSCQLRYIKSTEWYQKAESNLILGKVLVKAGKQEREQTKIVVPTGVQTIGEEAYEWYNWNDSTEEVVVPGSVRVIGDAAFR